MLSKTFQENLEDRLLEIEGLVGAIQCCCSDKKVGISENNTYHLFYISTMALDKIQYLLNNMYKDESITINHA